MSAFLLFVCLSRESVPLQDTTVLLRFPFVKLTPVDVKRQTETIVCIETCLLKIKYKKIIVSRATGGADKRVDGIKLLKPPGGVKGHLCFTRQGAPNA